MTKNRQRRATLEASRNAESAQRLRKAYLASKTASRSVPEQAQAPEPPGEDRPVLGAPGETFFKKPAWLCEFCRAVVVTNFRPSTCPCCERDNTMQKTLVYARKEAL